MSHAATLLEALEPLRADPERCAVLLDIDGTLAPIVRHESDAHVPEATRGLLIEISKRYGLVACVSGRRATTARRLVSIGSIAYVGNHGAELLRAGSTTVELDREVEEWRLRVRRFAERAWTEPLSRLRVRAEDKDAIAAFHWRGAPDEQRAHVAVQELAARAREEGLGTHWGRKVLEIRPPVALDKGTGVRALLRDGTVTGAIYVGDDTTDVDAFRGLRELRADGALDHAVCVGVSSEETPAELQQMADLMVEGTQGVRSVLEALIS